MKGKTKTYILLVIVLGIWGTVGYKFFDALNPDSPSIAQQDFTADFRPKELKPLDTFGITADYRDPFLGNFQKQQHTIKKNIPTMPSEQVSWPMVTYKGFVSGATKTEKVFLIQIQGQQHLIRKNEVVADMKLLQGNAKVVTILFKKEKKTFALQE
ncbi:hypothetical protein ACFQ1M_08445 [Sungkyunkwania multivorans]|uniref:Type II secretion system protein GspC N-terminal domain-containing protein n=1 Tax=Sungkyunkwania multivorans TaxID=1173618 RepID=A0ABW3CYT8_9FLAO